MNELSSQIANLSPEQLAKLAYELKASKAKKASKQPEVPKRVPGEPGPLSFAQQRLWFVAQLDPNNPAYNCMEALRMTGKLNVPLLEQVLNEVVRRHEILRTSFELVADDPMQIVSSKVKLKPRVIDLQGLPAGEQERLVAKLSPEQRLRPFDLTRSPLLRVVVLRISEHEHAIVLTTHHIISDAWSLGILTREITDLYSAFAEGRPSPLAELPFQYTDFATWQRQWLMGPVLEKHLDYWRQHLASAPHVLALPADHQRPAVFTGRGAHESLMLSSEFSHQLRALGRRKGVTLFMTMLAAFEVLLSRYSGQTDFLVGADVANRNHDLTESLIGFFVNQVALRADLSGNPTFSELLESVKEVTLNGYAHQDAPFEQVVDMLNPERNLSHAPLFQVKLVLQYAFTDDLELPEVTVGGGIEELSLSKLDLTLIIYDGNLIRVDLQYSVDLFQSSTISRMLTHFERLLASAVSNPEQHISQLELLSSAERQQLLVGLNDTQTQYPHARCIHELFEEQAALAPDAPALTFHEQHLSYAELNSRANQLAHYLRQLRVRLETPVGVCVNRSIEMVVAMLAILKTGGAYVPLDPEYPTERLAFIVEDLSLPVILTHSAIIPRHSSLVDETASTRVQPLCLDTDSELWSALPTTDLADSDSSSEHLAYVIYTSGSTGQPKGVAVPHGAIHNLVRGTNYVTLDESDVMAQVSNSSFDAATFEVWGALLSGARLVIIEKEVALAPHALAAQLEAHGVTVLFLTTALFNHMAREFPAAFRGLHHLLFGGEAVEPIWVREVLEKGAPRRLLHVYGPTETTTFATWHEVTSVGDDARLVPIGQPLTNVQVYLLDEHLRPVPVGVQGELYIGGDGLARGYYNQPELTADRFVPHPFSSVGGERLYRTGDYVRWGTENSLEFVGRVDTQVKIRGYRIEPGEVESVLGRHSSVSECAVVMRREADGQKYLVAYVVTNANGDGEHTFELRAYLRERLPDFMIPAAIVTLEWLPLTNNGKVDRRELAAREVLVGSERPYVPPRTTTEQVLRDVWQEVLHVERVGIDDNFFDLGGDSILTIQVIARARAADLELNVRQLFQYQTVRELAQELAREMGSAQESGAPPAETASFSLIGEQDRMRLPGGVVDAYPLTALQAGMLFHSELDPAAGLYHDIFSFHLRTPFDGEALQAALQQMIDLHPVLRTSFNLGDFSEPLQLVHEEVAVPLRVGDLRSLSPTEQEEYLAQWLAAEKQRRFDWRQAPLLRFQVERRSEETFQFSFSFHHAILDGWSVATLLTELFNDYAVRQTGERPSEAPLDVSFRDFVAAEQSIVNSEEAQHYWATMLSEAAHSRLPRLGQSAGPSRVAGHNVVVSPELLLQLKELARTAGVPLKSVLLAAHLRALNVLTGSHDVLTGIVSHGRPETTDGERVLGLFLNTLPLRRRLSGGTWLELVRETFTAEQELLPFRRYPMARMQQDLGNDTPLFEVTFNFVHFHVYEELQSVNGLEVLGFDGVGATNFTLAIDFSLELGGAQLGLGLQYDAAELSLEQIEAVGHNYLTILESMAGRPHEHYEQQCLLSPEERQKILYEWNDAAAFELDSECYVNLFEAQVRRTPNALAAVLNREQLTYDELNRRANQLARYLQAKGVGPEVPVGVLLERSLETLVALLAIFKAGGAYVPLDAEYPDERLRFMMRDAGLELLLTTEKLSSRFSDSAVKSVRMDADWELIEQQPETDVERGVSGEHLAYMIYTSGSTGNPKGVMITHRSLSNYLQWSISAYDVAGGKGAPLHSSIAFDLTITSLFPSLLTGRTVFLVAEKAGLSGLGQTLLNEGGYSLVKITPAHLELLRHELAPEQMAGLTNALVVGGEALPWQNLVAWRKHAPETRIINEYGPTETVVGCCVYEVQDVLSESGGVPIGKPIANTQLYILDQHKQPVPVGVQGELHIGGAGVGRGYLNQPEQTAEKFIPNPFGHETGARMYASGDLVRYLPDGQIEYLGRTDEQVKLRGYRIELGEIEAVLRRHSQVRAAVVVLKEEDEDKRLVAYVVSEAQTGELRAYLKEQLPDYMAPSFFVTLTELPLTPNGKINRRALPSPERISMEEAEYEGPHTQTEELLCGLWASVLRVNRVGINDNFVELGGHSLLAIQLIARIRDAFGVELPLSELFDRRTVAELAQGVDDLMRAGHELAVPPVYPATLEDVSPLSFAQQRLWFMDQLVPDNIAYNAADALRFRGGLNHTALEQSINEIMRRHEAVRTTFPEIDGNPSQVVTPFRHLALPLIDLSSLSDEDREAQAVRLGSAAAQRPFDLQSGPLMRATLLRLGAEDHVLLFCIHHIISDEWSTSILTSEVAALYDAFTTGAASRLPEIAIQYADFAVWQRQWLSGDVLARHLDYWTSKLQDAPALLTLPTDYPRPKLQLIEGAFCTHLLSAELTSALKSLAVQSGATLYMTIMAAFHALLHRYAQQATIVTGTVAANRTLVEIEPLIGLFANTLVLRSDFDDDPTFLTHLNRSRKHALEAYAHQDLPFEMLVDELQLARDLSYHPLFQVMFSWEETAWNKLALTGLELDTVDVENYTSQFDLTLRAGESNGQLRCAMQYNTALFEASTVSRMLTQFESLLASAVRDPEQHISRLELLSSAERHQLLVERNDTHIPYPHTRCIHELFEEQVALAPEAPCLTFQRQQLSYAELNSRANQLAHYLRQLAVGAELPVGICLNRSIDMVVAVFAVLKAGGIYIPLDPQYPTERLACILDEVQPSIILTDSSLIDELPSTAQALCLDTDQEWWSQLPDTNLTAKVSSGNLAHVLYTSGSTGKPKGVAVPHRGVVRLVKQETYVTYGPDEVFLQMGSLSFDASTLEIFSALLTGSRLVLMPPGAPSLDELADVLTSEGVTKLWVTAGLFHPMVEHRVNALAGVRDVMSGGDVLSVEHVRRLVTAKAGNGSVINGYGPTESTVFTCCHRVSSEDELERGVPIGKPIGNTEVYVLGDKLELLADGVVGELYVGGAGLARCYYKQPELTAERFVPHPCSTAGGERLYRTGDYARWRADGLMEFVGRMDTQVKIRGYRIEPGEVEAVLGRHASVSDCAVVARQEFDGEKQLVAYVVTKADGSDGYRESTFELREYLRERLPEFMIPSAIVAVDSLPLTPNGKVDRRELAGREVHVGSDRDYVAPRTATERMLCDIWQEVLHAERVGVNDNFFDLGGDSILSIQVIVKARALGLELNVRQLFQYQTVHELAQELAQEMGSAQESGAPPAETAPFSLIGEADRAALPAGVVDAYPLTALQAGMLFHSELDPAAGLYHDILSFHLRLPFYDEAMRAALQQMIDLHPVLRTSFNLSYFSEPLQLVHQEIAAPLRIGDLRSLSPDEQEEYQAEWLAAEKQHRFDWRQAPLLRFQIERRSEETFQFSFSFHHAILDGWSVATLLTELFNDYAVRQTGERPSEAPLDVSFRDFVAEERAILQSEEARQYWSMMLGDSTQTRLPRLIEAGPMRVAARGVKLSPELVNGLKELARTAGVPLKSVLLAAHLRVLSVLSGSDDVLTGVVSHGRTETAHSERVLGLFLNTLPFRQKLSGGSWSELVQETFQAERESLPFRRYPMARMQQDLGNHAPLFETIFSYTHFHVYDEMQTASGVNVLSYDGVGEINFMFGVSFSLSHKDSGIKMDLDCDAGQWSESQLEAAARYYLTTLEEMAQTPLARYEQQSLLSQAERRTILYEWNEPATDLPGECYHRLFEAQVARTPAALAAKLDSEQLTYDELNRRANQLAHYLQTLGVGPETPVGVLLERSLESLVALLAIFKAGGVYVPLDPQQATERLHYMMADARLSVLLTHTRFKEVLPETMRMVYFDLEREKIAAQSTANVAGVVDPANLAYVIYTSGSTGRPKGVAGSHGVVVGLCREIERLFELRASDRVLAFYSFSFDVSLEEILPPLLIGASLVVRGEKIWTSSEFVRTLAEDEITVIDLPTAYWHKLTEDCVAADAFTSCFNLRLMVVGGEAVLPEKVRLWQSTSMGEARLLVGYGPTEAIVTATWFEVPAPLPETWSLPTIPIGRGWSGRTACVLDPHGELAPVGVPGELHLGGPTLARGYLHRPELTAEKFIPDMFSDQRGGRMYQTGDLARYLPDGNIEFLGRIDHQVKIRGFRVELGEIEAVLKQHASVKEAVVLYEQEHLIAYTQLRERQNDLRPYLRERLPEYMAPAVFVEMAEFPLTPSGKINRCALPLPDQATTSDSELTTARDVLELQLTQIWEEELGREPIGLRDNFFDLGGHSLLALRLISKVERLVGQQIPLSILFQGATIEQLATALRQRGGTVREQSLVAIQADGSRPPLFLVHPASGNVMNYVALSRRLGREQPLYGLQSRGLHPDRKPTARVENMAAEYLEELLAVQPDGPYFLGGWSMGGVVAFEMARQLTAQGKSVAPLVLIDSSIQTGRVKKNGLDDVSLLLGLAQHHGLFVDDVDHNFDDLRSLGLDEQLEFLLEKGAGYNQFPLDIGIPQLRRLFDVFKVNVLASEHYRPAKSEQRVILLQAADAPPRQATTILRRWEKVAEVVAAQRLPGDHYTILTEPNVTFLAEQINSHLPA